MEKAVIKQLNRLILTIFKTSAFEIMVYLYSMVRSRRLANSFAQPKRDSSKILQDSFDESPNR